MTPEQKKILEDITHKKIDSLITAVSPSSSIIHLIEYARSKGLFFDEFYEFIYVDCINQYFNHLCLLDFIKNHRAFGISEPQCHYLVNRLYINSIFRMENHKEEFVYMLELTIETGIVFEEEILNHKMLAACLEPEFIHRLKIRNAHNRKNYISHQLPEKNTLSTTKI